MQTTLARNSSIPAAVQDAEQRYAAAHPESRALQSAARRVMPGGNTRSVLSYGPFPVAMERGEDCRLWDIDGHEYLDLCGEYTAGLFGHSEPRIHGAIRAALAGGLNLAAVGRNETRLAEIVCARFASIDQVRFTNSGTEANLMALAAARGFTGRAGIMAFRGGYHGGVLTYPITGASPAALPVPTVLGDYNDPDGAVALIQAHGPELAAVIVEPMLGSGGCLPAQPGFLRAVRDATAAAGTLLVFDEVMTSRMAAGGMQQRLGLRPDLTTFGKYMAGGMSFGAFGGRADVMAQFDGPMAHAGTFNNNVLSMAAGCVALGDIFTGPVVDALWHRGEALRAAVNEACADVPMQFTGLGSMLTPHFRRGALDRPFTESPAEADLRALFFFDMLEAGIYVARRGMVALSLPVGDAETQRFVAAVTEFVASRRALFEGD